MTIEEVLNFPADKWEKMTDQEILDYFKESLTVTRPELAPKPIKTTSSRNITDPKKQMAMQLLGAFGVDLSEL